MVLAANLGYPRLGARRELKRALEQYWSGKMTPEQLLAVGKNLRAAHWQLQRAAGIDVIPSNDFSFYDQMLDTAVMVGAIPKRYGAVAGTIPLDTYFAMARGAPRDGLDVPAMEMTKWFDTNYHYIVPEIDPQQTFQLRSIKAVDEFNEAKALGIHTRPVLIGPMTFSLLSKSTTPTGDPVTAATRLLPVYAELLKRLEAAGADWVQLDEPALVLDLPSEARAAFRTVYRTLTQTSRVRLMLTSYFGALGENLALALNAPVAGLHLDLVRAPQQLETALTHFPRERVLSVGVVNGRNVWRTNLDAALRYVQRAAEALGSDRVQVAPNCSLLYSPQDLALETELDPELYSWLAFARQKLDELVVLKRAANEGVEAVAEPFAAGRAAMDSRRASPRARNPHVREQMATIDATMLNRRRAYAERRELQARALPLPLLPTTTIGSFPQTAEVRARRAAAKSGRLDASAYEAFLKSEIERTIHWQETIGLDVLVHGEFERSDMVEYFGEQLASFAFTRHGWVQSYGSRAVRPPIIYGDVARPAPLTVAWSVYAQSLTSCPVKGMLTGPVTILQWSFVRDDQPRADTCKQIALALRQEVLDLEAAGIHIIQVDEPALREGLPLRQAAWDEYLKWAVDCFRLVVSGVRDETQIHTHMCYGEFNDIIQAIGRMDADVISIEASRSKMELLAAFSYYQYPNAIGPGVYDIHSPRVPSQAEMYALIQAAAGHLSKEQLWLNPDCGLKTRSWEQIIPALENMVAAARRVRADWNRTEENHE